VGSPESEEGRREDEGPQHKVTFPKPFAVGRFAVTFDEWDYSARDGGPTSFGMHDGGWGRGRRPVIFAGHADALSYVAWLAKKTAKPYRLLSEAEWEYAARAGTNTPFWWGNSISTGQANYDGNLTYGTGVTGEDRHCTLPVDSFEPNPWGLYQVHGNVFEWTADWHTNNYNSVWISEGSSPVLRGGAWYTGPQHLRAAVRRALGKYYTNFGIGFRVARTLTEP
jgi:formylglycine-generating enzyme required for sulfatase activity